MTQEMPVMFGIDPDATWEFVPKGSSAKIVLKAPSASLDQEWQIAKSALFASVAKAVPDAMRTINRLNAKHADASDEGRKLWPEEDQKAHDDADWAFKQEYMAIRLDKSVASLAIEAKILSACVVGWEGLPGKFPSDKSRIVDFFRSEDRIVLIDAIFKGAELTKKEVENL